MDNPAQPNDTLAQHLKDSGLTAAHAKLLKWRETIHDMGNYQRPAIEIPYFDLRGKPMKHCRYRYLDTAYHNGPKYGQDAGTPNRVFFPRTYNWQKLPDSSAIFITEGEKKAAKACAEGFPCLGLGGVNSFMDSSRAQGLIPDLEEFSWEGRTVYVVYDSDAEHNRNVRLAMLQLASALYKLGRVNEVRAIKLSERGDIHEKIGLDDFLVKNGPAAFRQLISDAMPLTAAHQRLLEMSSRYCVVSTPFEIRACDPKSLDFAKHWSRSDWEALNEGEVVIVPQGNGRLKAVPLTKEWFPWFGRNTVSRCDVLPDKPTGVVVTDEGERVLNLFRGLGVKPKRGSVEPWKKLLKGLFHGARSEYIPWFEQWLAHQVQHPGQKLFQSVFIWGSGQGTGKSSIGVVMGKLFGESAATISEDQLNGRFNAFLEGTLFAMADDLPVNDARSLRGRIKGLVTNERLMIERKYTDSYMIQNRCNFFFTANSAAAYPLDVGDNRRTLVIEAPTKRPYPLEWYTGEWDKWVNGDGPAHLLYYLLRLDLRSFKKNADAPQTGDLLAAAQTTTPVVESWIRHASIQFEDWCEEHGLLAESMVYCTAKQLVALYNTENPHITVHRMSRAMGDVLMRIDGQTRINGRLVQVYKLSDKAVMPKGAEAVTNAIRKCFEKKGVGKP